MVLEDNNKNRPVPILATISHPNSSYYKALTMFTTRYAIGVADYDTLVPAASATICAGCPK